MKDTTIQIKIDSETKEKFFAWCKNRAINPSEWLRARINEVVKEVEK